MFTEDLDSFFDDFGIEVAFKRGVTPVATSLLILNTPEAMMNLHDRSFYDKEFYGAKVQNRTVELLGVEASLSDLRISDVATVNAQDWYVIDLSPDGTGLLTIYLSANQI